LHKITHYRAAMQPLTRKRTFGRIGAWLFVAACLGLLGSLVFLMSRPVQTSSFDQDPRFVVTAVHEISVSPNAGLLERGFVGWFQFRQKMLGRRPGTYSFPVSPTTGCSIHGLLMQCTDISGVRYVIPKDVAAGRVQFGTTNVLTGPQWVQAFTEALQHGQPGWWDSKAKTSISENLVLVTNDIRTVLVLPRSWVREFQSRSAK
jgi:hypothetical protein